MLRHLVKAAIDDRVGVVIYKIKVELKNVVCSIKLADDIFYGLELLCSCGFVIMSVRKIFNC